MDFDSLEQLLCSPCAAARGNGIRPMPAALADRITRTHYTRQERDNRLQTTCLGKQWISLKNTRESPCTTIKQAKATALACTAAAICTLQQQGDIKAQCLAGLGVHTLCQTHGNMWTTPAKD